MARRSRSHSVVLALVGLLVLAGATSLPSVRPAQASGVVHALPGGVVTMAGSDPPHVRSARAATGSSDWLGRINVYRRGAGLPAVTEHAAWSVGIAHHNTYLAKTPSSYFTGEYRSAHTENPSSPYYTADGDHEARRSNIVQGAVGYSPTGLIDIWWAAPFHAIGMLRPALTQVAFASDATSGNAGEDVISGLTGSGTTKPVLFPGPGMTTNLTSFGGEFPDPLESCHFNVSGERGLPIVALLPMSPSSALSASMTGPDGHAQTVANGDLCIIDEHTYTSTDTVYGPTGLQILQGDRAVLLVTKTPHALGRQQVKITQPGQATIAWSFTTTTGAPTADSSRTVKVHVSDGPATVLGNLTLLNGPTGGYATAYGCASGRPDASNVNFAAGQAVANFVVARSDANGDLCVWTSTSADVIWDQVGQTSVFTAGPAVRLLDTRSGSRPSAGSTTRVHTGNANQAVLANLTVAQAAGSGYTTAYPCAAGRPNASNNNFRAGDTVANFVTVESDADGDVCLFTSAAAHLIWDQVAQTSTFAVANAVRLLDSRSGPAPRAGSVTRVHTGQGGAAVLVNLTVTGAAGTGYTTVYPCTAARPGASNSNYVTGQTVPNFVIAQSDADGDVCIFTSASAHLLWDQVGRTTAFSVGPPQRLLDTRSTAP